MDASSTLGAASSRRESGVIGLICTAHFVSHFYILVLPPLFPFLKAHFGVGYTELGLALTVFNVTTAFTQTPAGFLVDRIGPARILIGGLVLGGVAIALAGILASYWALVAMFALAGLANAVYHPADYSILSATVRGKRVGRAFSFHTFSGYLGSAVAPATMLGLTAAFGWQMAMVIAGGVGVAVAAALALRAGDLAGETPVRKPGAAPAQGGGDGVRGGDGMRGGLRLLFSPAILGFLVFFLLITMSATGISAFSVVALAALHDTPLATANLALTGYLLLSALGVLVGGYVADATDRHGLVTATSFAITGALIVLVGAVDLDTVLLILILSVSGLAYGIIMPSRDMMVRSVTPPGSFGKVFGFVSTGFNIGGAIAPLLYGWIMDAGMPFWVFAVSAGFMLCGVAMSLGRPRTRRGAA